MNLVAGTRLGPYEIVGPLGAGGMGEVYQARDTRLDRSVAVKVLPPHVAGDPEFRERFEREARTISQLNHPHICTLYDVGEAIPTNPESRSPNPDSVSFLVMEHLQGETLAARIAKGALPVDQAVVYAIQIADGVNAAHRRGILHRDLKPGNVMITASGVKLLDFGLAKTVSPATVSGAAALGASSEPVTMATPLTVKGSILGTFQYMAPEVVEGEDADARADIWAFGCMLFEMLTGGRPFAGKTQAGLVGAILKEDPPAVSTLQPLVPPALGRIVRTCLAKDPNQRVQSAHDLLLNLQWAAEGGSAAGIPAPVLARRRSRDRMLVMAVTLAVGVAAAAVTWLLKPAPDVARVVRRFVHTLPDDQRFTRGGRHTIAIAPDGSFFIYVANQQLYLRRMDQLDAQPIKGTQEDPVEPFISPDGKWVAYFVPGGPTSVPRRAGAGRGQTGAPGQPAANQGTLKKIPISGGAPIVLAALGAPFGSSWHDDTIVVGQATGGIVSIPEGGGTLTPLITPQEGEAAMASPQLLDGGRRVLFTLRRNDAPSWNQAQIVVQTLDGGARALAISGGHDGRVTADGTLLYVRDGTLFGAPFDAKRGERTGEPVPLIVGVTVASGAQSAGPGQYAVSAEGHLAYVQGAAQTAGPIRRTLMWVDRQGREEPIAAEPREYIYPRVSPDGSRIALDLAHDGTRDTWIWDVEREILGRFTLERDEGAKWFPVWSRDGRFVFYSSSAGERSVLSRRAADGTGSPEAVSEELSGSAAVSFVSRDNSSLVFWQAGDVFSLALTGKRTPQPVIVAPSVEDGVELSPDGRWIAYQSNESGRPEIIVRPFPAVANGRWQVSIAGGVWPLWSRNGRELFYRSPDSRLMSVPIGPGSGFVYGRASALFDVSPYFSFGGRTWDATPDGRFVFIKDQVTAPTAEPIVVVEHWMDEVKARLRR